jgi:hypothetical protein
MKLETYFITLYKMACYFHHVYHPNTILLQFKTKMILKSELEMY